MAKSRFVPVITVLGLVLVGSAVMAEETDLSGAWTLTMEGQSPTGQQSADLTFHRDGHNLVATMKGEKGEVKCQGYVDGNRIRFYYVRPSEKGEFVAKYTGHVAGDLMGGEVDMGELGKTKWRATRGPGKGYDLSGEWLMTMEGESPSGQQSATLTFRQEANNLVVTMVGARGKVECEGWIDGNALRFYYIRPSATAEFVAKYTGHVGGDTMGGEVDMGEQGKTTWRATRKH